MIIKNMKLKKFRILAMISFYGIFVTNNVFAGSYTTREIVPGETTGSNDFLSYLNSLYTFGVGISALLAIFMIGFGAFKYTVFSAGNASTMSDAKETIYSAIFGLGIALTAWLILNIINPDLTRDVMTTIPSVRSCLDPAGCN